MTLGVATLPYVRGPVGHSDAATSSELVSTLRTYVSAHLRLDSVAVSTCVDSEPRRR